MINLWELCPKTKSENHILLARCTVHASNFHGVGQTCVLDAKQNESYSHPVRFIYAILLLTLLSNFHLKHTRTEKWNNTWTKHSVCVCVCFIWIIEAWFHSFMTRSKRIMKKTHTHEWHLSSVKWKLRWKKKSGKKVQTTTKKQRTSPNEMTNKIHLAVSSVRWWAGRSNALLPMWSDGSLGVWPVKTKANSLIESDFERFIKITLHSKCECELQNIKCYKFECRGRPWFDLLSYRTQCKIIYVQHLHNLWVKKKTTEKKKEGREEKTLCT